MTVQGSLFTNTAPGFYNTTNLEGEELKEKQEKVVSQNGEILAVFADHPHWKMTPWKVLELLKTKPPITSVRRAITTLEHEGYLLKTDTTVIDGPYATKNYQWMLHPDKKKI